MASRGISDFGFRISDLAWGCVFGLAALAITSAAIAETYAERAARVAALSPGEKAELLKKKQRFDALSEEEKQRLRQLHESLSSAPDSQQLQVLLTRYSNWLKGLQPGRRADLLDLPSAERIVQMKEIVREQERQRFSEFVYYNVPDEDQKKIYEWLDGFVLEKEDEILGALRDDRDRRHIRHIDDDRARRRTLITRLGFRRPDSKIPFPSKEEIGELVAGLSETTRKELEKAADAKTRQDREQQLVFGAIWSISFPPPSEEELSKYFAQLSPERRSELENLDRDDLQRSLRRMYRADKLGWRGGPPRGGDGFRGSRPGPPGPPGPDLDKQPPGFASPKTKK
jgi:hypothetical protein